MNTIVYVGTYEYELCTFIGRINENDDEDMPLLKIYTAIDLRQDDNPWLAIIRNSDGEYTECCIGGYETEKELAAAIYNSFSSMATADFVESKLFD